MKKEINNYQFSYYFLSACSPILHISNHFPLQHSVGLGHNLQACGLYFG